MISAASAYLEKLGQGRSGASDLRRSSLATRHDGRPCSATGDEACREGKEATKVLGEAYISQAPYISRP